jgi:diacylglycerol kinase (ATP)
MPAPPWIHRKEAVVIVNPTARKLPSQKCLREARNWLDERGWAVEWLETAAPGDATQLAADAAHREVPLLFVCGGDGTLNEAVNGLAGSETALAVIQSGTVILWAR